jgi:hypothetical protein
MESLERCLVGEQLDNGGWNSEDPRPAQRIGLMNHKNGHKREDSLPRF